MKYIMILTDEDSDVRTLWRIEWEYEMWPGKQC